MAQCKLCLKSRDLCNSHIIPELYYQSLYEKKPKRFYLIDSAKGKIEFPQKGIREKLFCRKCENIFMDYEQYAEKIWREIKSRFIYPENEFIQFNNVNYPKFKLFQLSILFRASISTLYYFENINIGHHEKILRKRLLKNNPGKYYEYACSMTLLIENVGISDKLIDLYPDVRVHDDGERILRFVFGGIIWMFYPTFFPPRDEVIQFHSLGKNHLKLWTKHRKNTDFVQIPLNNLNSLGKFDEIARIRHKLSR